MARRQADARAIARIRKVSPEDAVQLKAKLDSGQVGSAAARYLEVYGMSPNNLVDNTALYLAIAWFASRANPGDPSPAQMQGLRRQVAATFATMPGVLTASNAAKKALAEANIIQAMIAGALANQAAHNSKTAGTIRTSVISGVRDSYQLDPTRLVLTPQGLR